MVGFSASTTCALLLLLIFFFYLPTVAISLSFNYSTFSSADQNAIKIEGDASFSVGWVDISANRYGSIDYSNGRYTPQPMLLWDRATGEVASFTTRFSFVISGNISSKGQGMAFFLAGYPSSLPARCPDYNLALTNQSADAVPAGDSRFVAVEFDTFNNTVVSDPHDTFDHIGIDISSLRSVRTLTMPSFELTGNLTADINYDNVSSILSVTVWLGDDNEGKPRNRSYNLRSKVDLKSALPEQVSVGFSASTSNAIELHQLHSWSFISSLEPPPPPAAAISSLSRLGPGVIAGAAAGASVSLVLIFAATVALVVRRHHQQKMVEMDEYHTDSEGEGDPMMEIEMVKGPRRFSYHELVEATRNFAAEEKLGQGGFGAVYRGYLREPAGLPVAIKRFSKHDSSLQGKREYKSEIKVISRLRHRNLVQLLGWSHGREELLLVYELMPNRSLDIHLHGKQGTFLTWPMRMRIVMELGSVLLYLHEEWEQCVLHRDIKPSNMMLDESFGAKLGDFGLARLVDHATGTQTMTAVSGTPGYLDPQCVVTGRASTESDVYSFGVVLLEVVCGRKPMSFTATDQDQQQKNGGVFRLVEWVWGLYGRGSILESADKLLNGDLDAAQVERVLVVGLWCAHPDPSARPTIREAMAKLHSKVDKLPVLPSKMPVPTYAQPPSALDVDDGLSTLLPSSTSTSVPPHTTCTTTSSSDGHEKMFVYDESWFKVKEIEQEASGHHGMAMQDKPKQTADTGLSERLKDSRARNAVSSQKGTPGWFQLACMILCIEDASSPAPGMSGFSTATILLIFFYLPAPAVSLSFNYSTFSSADQNDIKIEGDASFSVGWIDISANRFGNIDYSNGRASYNARPMLLWDKATGEVASFTTRFSFAISGDINSKGQGMAFFLAAYPSSRAGGQPTYDHIGIDVNSLRSVSTQTLPSFELTDNLTAMVEYDNVRSILAVTVWVGDDRSGQARDRNYSLRSKVDLKSALPEQVSVGFSASTSNAIELHQLRSWSFNSSLEPPPPPSPPPAATSSPSRPGPGVIAGAAAGATLFLVLLFAATAALVVRRRHRQRIVETEDHYTDSEGEGDPMTEIEMGTGPRRFPYQELVEATRNFAAEEKLGQGGFGAVYRGYLREPAGLAVAIKRFSKHESSLQGKREYKSEIKVISRLRHRNLVQLLGWCHGREELLLVYELMPNRSLDIHLHGKQGTFLTWPMRMKILLELGSALLYLHEEWEQCVLHRDIKPSNVMLDESFGAKLGDFGLARLVDHAAGTQTMTAVSGTPGYLDPQCIVTGRASAESDVYSFGVVLLEVEYARFKSVNVIGRQSSHLVNWYTLFYVVLLEFGGRT
ncbi:L-type lectin-domain containing receptor kinase IX.1 [Triticum urartu]|uniref:non-specific serine/threonine protein kinase n=1 Tax=Triticum urartu TaxID=4572 RepID=M8A3Y8_TRIUA|nr:L-type lectin-domain containing receptor kinase IX.1 [Triticum urartu]